MTWMSKVCVIDRSDRATWTLSQHFSADQILDEFWLKELNAERRKQDLSDVSSSMFERIFDRLEKEWFDLVSC